MVYLFLGSVVLVGVTVILSFLHMRWTRGAIKAQSRGIQWILGALRSPHEPSPGLPWAGEKRHKPQTLEELETEISELDMIRAMSPEEYLEFLDSPGVAADHPVISMDDEQILLLERLRKQGALSPSELAAAKQDVERLRRESS